MIFIQKIVFSNLLDKLLSNFIFLLFTLSYSMQSFDSRYNTHIFALKTYLNAKKNNKIKEEEECRLSSNHLR